MSVAIHLKEPHSEGQASLLEYAYSDVAFCGRRWGKTEIAVYRIFMAALNEPGLYWWVGLSWKSASLKRAWSLIKQLTRQIYEQLGENPEPHIRESSKEVHLPNQAAIWMRTAERPDSLAGEGIHGVVMDEFSLMEERVWTEFIEGTLMDHQGWALFIGVPKGENWATRLWRMAETREGWRQHRYTTYDNARLSADWIDQTRNNTPERIFQQEYLAEILTDGGAVFRFVDDAFRGSWCDEPARGHRYVMGCDWGKLHDYSAFVVMDRDTQAVVYVDHMRQIDYQLQLKRLDALARKFQVQEIVAERNAMGEPLIEQLSRHGLPLTAFQTTAQSKPPLIEALAIAFENGQVTLPMPEFVTVAHKLILETMKGELLAYTMEERSKHGGFSYSAPPGGHDDLVMALALAYHSAGRPAPRQGGLLKFGKHRRRRYRRR